MGLFLPVLTGFSPVSLMLVFHQQWLLCNAELIHFYHIPYIACVSSSLHSPLKMDLKWPEWWCYLEKRIRVLRETFHFHQIQSKSLFYGAPLSSPLALEMLMRMKSCALGPETHHPGPALVPASGVRRFPAGDEWSMRAYPSSPGVSEGWGIWRMGGLDIRNGGITDQRVPLSSWMRSFRGRQKSCFPAHMLPAAPIYQSVRRLPGCAQSEHHAGAPCNRMHSFGKQHSSVLKRGRRRRKE